MAPRIAGYLSKGLARWNIIRCLLPEYGRQVRLKPGSRRSVDAILGWGLKPTSVPARRLAERRGLPYVAIEDGFLRSLGLGVHYSQPHSLAVDFSGIYYDATRPSDLEQLLIHASFAPEELARARHAMQRLRELRLSKYNHAPDRPLPAADGQRVLVIDQTRDDASITHGLADESSFQRMLEAALGEYPEAEILIKTHPDVIAGRKRGYLTGAAGIAAVEHPRCRLISEDLNPWALIDAADAVYVVTSQLGFEALIANKPVHCFGMPFYAGWGLTRDAQTCARRNVSRTLPELFTAAYLRYCRYANPYTGQPSTLEATIDLIADQKRQRDRLAGNWLAMGFSSWKRAFIKDFLGPASSVHFIQEDESLADHAGERDSLVVWGQKVTEEIKAFCHRHEIRLWRMEDGFLRSVGLGVDLIRPLSLAFDSRGLYYDANHESDLERLLNATAFDEHQLARAGAIRQRLIELRLSKYNVKGNRLPDLSAQATGSRPIVLVPGQVETDASIAQGSPEIKSNQALLAAVRDNRPDAFIVYKPHPDVVSGARVGLIDDEARALFDLELVDCDIVDLIDIANEIHTMCSLTGFEGLMRGVEVHTYGLPFYAGWGLTHDRLTCDRRRRKLTVEALIAGTLLSYPTYVDPTTGEFCNAETAIELVSQQRQSDKGPSLRVRCYRLYRNLFSQRQ
ncbi:capsular polysaccharide biosynthesis protein [Salinicola rhizosphaerae]|uniref:Capsule polysaccharide modification protein LipA n=1 Tax=Salinicola rhizosphaerae TaxID=1443141 RepID=A0ABQ3DR07_9GAMM|nr:capsular polysaccharide biosynthesis protein [Salinicola rhizosphaerae]GHB11328.1 capsule polysaccharide modification protein LipA [Salinicola rhizosphaerae]